MDSGQTKLVALLVAAVILAGGAITFLMFMQPIQEPQNQENLSAYYVTVVGGDGVAINVTLGEMLNMTTVSRDSSYQNSYGNIRGRGNYTGVKVSDLVDLVGGMNEKDTLKVIAGDGYTQLFGYAKVYPNQTYSDIQGDMVLAYEYNGTRVPDYQDGFRLTFLPEDGYYSNADANATTDPNPSAAGPQWVSNVTRIEVLPYTYSVTLNLVESQLRTLPATSGEGGYKTKGGTINGPFNFTGVRVSYFLEQISDLPENFIVISTSGDGYTSTYTKAQVYGELSGYNATGYPANKINSTMLVAYEENGTSILGENGGPLKIVFINEDGNLTDGYLWSKDVVNLTILEVSPQSSASYTTHTDFGLSVSTEIIAITRIKFD